MIDSKKETLATAETDFFEMAKLSPKRTGLPFVVWIPPKAGVRTMFV